MENTVPNKIPHTHIILLDITMQYIIEANYQLGTILLINIMNTVIWSCQVIS